MSESVRSLLVRGTAAAKAGDKDEALFYLERAMYQGDATDEQRVETLIWIARLTDDLKKKRDLLSDAFAIDMSDPRVRQELAILDGRLNRSEILDAQAEVKPVEVPSFIDTGGVRRYTCPQCGSRLGYNPDGQTLGCDHCGFSNAPKPAGGVPSGLVAGPRAPGADERDFAATLPTARAHRWQLAGVRTLICQGCSAQVALPPAEVSAVCPFCDSPHVIIADETRELIAPDGVVPFQFNGQTALKHIFKWWKALPGRPEDVDRTAQGMPIRGLYVPVWTFDIFGDLTWHAIAHEMHERYPHGMTGAYPLAFDDLRIPGSSTIPKKLFYEIDDFETNMESLTPYTPDLLVSWPTEVYQLPLAEASLAARERAHQLAQQSAKEGLLRTMHMVNEFNMSSLGMVIDSYKLVLVPIWIGGFVYKEHRYHVLVNGQTGKVGGQAPETGMRKVLKTLFGG